MMMAALVLGAGGALLAVLPAGAVGAVRFGLVGTGLAALAVSVWAAVTAAGGPDGVGGGAVFVPAASLLGLLLMVACAGDPGLGGSGGMRLRLARASTASMVGASVAALSAATPVGAVAGLIGCALLGTLAAGSARGTAAALAAWRLLRLQGMAAAASLAGLMLVQSGAAGPGGWVLLAGVAALAGLAPFGGAAADAQASAEPWAAPFLGALLPFTGLAVLLRVRLAVVAAGGEALVEPLLLGSGLLAVAVGAARAWSGGARAAADARGGAALFGVAVLGFGLGDAAGLDAGLLLLLAASFAVPALVLAGRFEAGVLGRSAVLAASALPPSGLFAASLLVVGRTAATRPALLGPLLVLLGLLLTGLLRSDGTQRPPATRTVRGVLLACLALAGVGGVLLPLALADRMVGVAERLAGEVRR